MMMARMTVGLVCQMLIEVAVMVAKRWPVLATRRLRMGL